MSAPAGNSFWKQRSSHGRKPIFASPDELQAACIEYLEWVDSNPLYEAQAFAYQGAVKIESVAKLRAMTIAGLCVFLDIDRTTWADYATKDGFSPVTTQVEEIIRDQKFSGAAAGLLNANIIARDLGLADKSETDTTIKADDTITGLLARIASEGKRLATPSEDDNT